MSIFSSLKGQQQAQQPSQQQQMNQLMRDPIGTLRQAGYNVPAEMAGNPQAMVHYLLRTGQIAGPMQQRILPMISKMLGK